MNNLIQHPNFPFWVWCAGIALSILALVLIVRKFLFLKNSQKTLGTVVEVMQRSAMEGHLWCSRIEYEDHDTKRHAFDYISSGPKPPFAVKHQIPIHYHAKQADKAYINRFWQMWSTEMAALSLAVIVMWIATFNLH